MSNVCQTLKSSLDPPLFEPHNSLRHLVPSKQVLPFPWPQQAPKTEKGSTKTEQVYVHPLVACSFSSLTSKSLEMCTESLGNESGNDFTSDFDRFSRHAFGKTSLPDNKPAKNRESSKKTKKARDFPPPLTSVGGDEGIQVHTHHEAGRLVVKAFHFSPPKKFFRAERENGRLRLCLVRDHETDDLADDEEEDEEKVDDENANDGKRDYFDGGESSDENGRYWGDNGQKEDGRKIRWCGCRGEERPIKEATDLGVLRGDFLREIV